MAGLQMDTALEQVVAAQRRLRLEPSDPIGDAIAGLHAGAGMPDDLGEQLLAQQHRFDAYTAARGALDQIAQRLQAERTQHLSANADEALDVLREDLDKILDRGEGALDLLNGIYTAEAAIAAARVDEWQTGQQIANDYRELRELQAVVTAIALQPRDVARASTATQLLPAPSRRIRELVLTLGTLLDFPDRYPAGYTAREPYLQGTSITRVEAIGEPNGTPLPWATSDPLENLAWIAANRDSVWLPSVAELRQAQDRADTAREQLLEEQREQRRAAKERNGS
jgi:hypothetical protein